MMKIGACDYLVKDSKLLSSLPTIVSRVLREKESELKLIASEQALKESEIYNRLLFQDSSLPLIVMDPKNRQLIDCNNAAVMIFQLNDKDELLKKNILDVSSPAQYDNKPSQELITTYIQQAQTKGSTRFEWCYQCPDGNIRDAEVVLTSFIYKNKQLMQLSLNDITERRRNEQRLKLSAQILSDTSEAVMLTNKDFEIIDINPAFIQITGYELDDISNKHTDILLSAQDNDQSINKIILNKLEIDNHWHGELQLRHKNGGIFTALFNISQVGGLSDMDARYVYLFSDISTIKADSKRLDYLAHHDPLTNLPNRLLFNARLQHSINLAERNKKCLGLLFLDLDFFKEVNDTLGHASGDTLLQNVSKLMSDLLRDEDTVARLAGDEFVFLIEDISHPDQLSHVAEKILKLFPYQLPAIELSNAVTASIGGALYPNDAANIEDLLAIADHAMYKAKEDGRNQYCYLV